MVELQFNIFSFFLSLGLVFYVLQKSDPEVQLFPFGTFFRIPFSNYIYTVIDYYICL